LAQYGQTEFSMASSPTIEGRASGLIRLSPLMALTAGSADIRVALLDGPVAVGHPALAPAHIEAVAGQATGCAQPESSACAHGTFVAGILAARRGSLAPAVCPDCTLLVRPIFRESADAGGMPTTVMAELAQAIVDCVSAGACVINISAAPGTPSTRTERALREALDHAARHGALVVAAAGNQGTLGSSDILRHRWVIPVAAVDEEGRPLRQSNLGSSIGRRGLAALGEAVESLSPQGGSVVRDGTSFAAAFVTGAIALLWSLFPSAGAASIRRAVTFHRGRTAVAPPLLDAWGAYEAMAYG
jgi:subtilisin family serine protease